MAASCVDGVGDLIIAGGRVIDPSQSIDAKLDVAMSNGRVAKLGRDLQALPGSTTIDAAGLIVTPGLIDLHTHDFWGASRYGIDPDTVHLANGVTTVVDAGSSGANTFPAFHEYVIRRSRTRILALLNISSMGMALGYGGLDDLRWANVDAAANMGIRHRGVVVGVKARAPSLPPDRHREILRRALTAAERMDGFFMLHLGGDSLPVAERLNMLRTGDALTHSFRWSGDGRGILGPSGAVLDEAWAAKERGVFFDVGHGGGSFSFETAERAMAQRFHPDTISSDLHIGNVDAPVRDLVTTLSKFLYLGVELPEVIRLATESPARVLGKERELGTLRPGAAGDAAVLALEDGRFEFADAGRRRVVEASQRLRVVRTIKDGRVVEAWRASGSGS